jgi:hypothetical protein
LSDALATAARSLAHVLAAARPLWQPAPFRGEPPWLAAHPALTEALLVLDEGQVAALEAAPARLVAFVARFIPAAAQADAAMAACLAPSPPAAAPLPEKLGRDVPGRKWQQLANFARALSLPAAPDDGELVEWCAGKGHLGRLLARTTQRPVRSLEWDERLCDEGRAMAARDHVEQEFVCIDVLQGTADNALDARSHACALHACGDLHRRLIDVVIVRRAASLHLSPCCLHLMRADRWQPETRALHGTLDLSRDDLRLAVQDTVTASAAVVRAAQQLAAWRQGYDLLQRDLRGVDEYLPAPSLPARVLREGFPAFCRRLATLHGLTLPDGTDFARREAAGIARQARTRRLELLRHAFRRPLEVLVACDRALLLAEAGYRVDITTFCPRPLTPRNLLIRAVREPAAVR